MNNPYIVPVERAKRLGVDCYDSGYLIMLAKPIVTISNSMDVEGVGFVRTRPQPHVQRYFGWYMYQDDAEFRLGQLIESGEAKSLWDRSNLQTT
jgi:hypothetical protein